MDNNDFRDIDLGSLGLGALAGGGGEDHYASRNGPAKDGSGVDYILNCDPCGMRQAITVSWDELIFVSEGVAPPGNPATGARPWQYSARHGALHPDEPCCGCGRRETLLLLTPDEAERQLRAGAQAQRVPPDYIARAKGTIRQQRGHYTR